MYCPSCSACDTKVIDSRIVSQGQQIRRRRECLDCTFRFTTYETIELSLPRLIKQDGSFVQFDETKLRGGILKALGKRAVATKDIDEIISKIVNKLRSHVDREITTRTIGDWVMDELKQIDEIGYIRFASVYREFKNIDELLTEIGRLKEEVYE